MMSIDKATVRSRFIELIDANPDEAKTLLNKYNAEDFESLAADKLTDFAIDLGLIK
jgi:hypothetical protein